jgi:hypothetical protein
MDISKITKGILFGQYLCSCKVRWLREEDNKIIISDLNTSDFNYLLLSEKSKLILKPLSNLSREDAIFLYCSKNGLLRTERVSLVEYSFSNNILGIEIHSPDYSSQLIPKDYFSIESLPAKYIDYLRSKGYAIPYRGLSVEKLVEYGWVVLA